MYAIYYLGNVFFIFFDYRLVYSTLKFTEVKVKKGFKVSTTPHCYVRML